MTEWTFDPPTRETYSVLWRRILSDPVLRARLLEGRGTRDPESLAADRIAGEDRPSREDLRAA